MSASTRTCGGQIGTAASSGVAPVPRATAVRWSRYAFNTATGRIRRGKRHDEQGHGHAPPAQGGNRAVQFGCLHRGNIEAVDVYERRVFRRARLEPSLPATRPRIRLPKESDGKWVA